MSYIDGLSITLRSARQILTTLVPSLYVQQTGKMDYEIRSSETPEVALGFGPTAQSAWRDAAEKYAKCLREVDTKLELADQHIEARRKFLGKDNSDHVVEMSAHDIKVASAFTVEEILTEAVVAAGAVAAREQFSTKSLEAIYVFVDELRQRLQKK